MSMLDTETPLFIGGGLSGYETEATADTAPPAQLASPFSQGFGGADDTEQGQGDLEVLVGELADEEFDETVQSLVDEIAGRHLRIASRRDGQDVDVAAIAEVSSWTEALADSVERSLAELEARYQERRVDSLTDEEAQAAVAEFARDPDSASERFLGGLVRKAVRIGGAVARGALSGLSRLMPMGRLFGLLRKLVRPLLRRVLARAINRLPASLRGPATQLATTLGVRETEYDEAPDLAEQFDTLFGELLLAPSDAAEAELFREAEAEVIQQSDPLADLDRARATLARQLAEGEPGRPPTEQMEQFIPAVMAAMPLIRTGVRIVGRGKVKRFLARQLATLIQGYIGPQAARALAPHVAEGGLRLLSLETESPELLGAEALVGMLEETIARVAALPDEALNEPLRLEAETADALASAAARYLPSAVLREDVTESETDGESVPWVAMPRPGRVRRYRKCARRYDVQIPRSVARQVELTGEDTLEDRLLDAGVTTWPVNAEVDLFETTVGTHLGHLAAMEGEDVTPAEFEELSSVNAGLLLGRPALGTIRSVSSPPVRRLFRLVVPGRKVVRRRRRVRLRLLTRQPKPELRVYVRLGERLAHHIAGLLARNGHADLVSLFNCLLSVPVRYSVATRLTRMLARGLRSAVPPFRGEELSVHIFEAMLATLAKQLPQSAVTLATAAKDPASGLTLTFAFPFADRAALAGGRPESPSLTIRPGIRCD